MINKHLTSALNWEKFCAENYKNYENSSLEEFNKSLISLFRDTPEIAQELIEEKEIKGVLDFDAWDVLENTNDYEGSFKFWNDHNSKFFTWELLIK